MSLDIVFSGTMSSVAYIALGSNLGDRRATLEGAIASLARTSGVVVQRVSAFSRDCGSS